MNGWDIGILAAIACAVGFALYRMRKRKDKGCHGSCSCCAYSENCPSQRKTAR